MRSLQHSRIANNICETIADMRRDARPSACAFKPAGGACQPFCGLARRSSHEEQREPPVNRKRTRGIARPRFTPIAWIDAIAFAIHRRAHREALAFQKRTPLSDQSAQDSPDQRSPAYRKQRKSSAARQCRRVQVSWSHMDWPMAQPFTFKISPLSRTVPLKVMKPGMLGCFISEPCHCVGPILVMP